MNKEKNSKRKCLNYILIVILAVVAPLSRVDEGDSDLIAYWSSTRLLITGGNPYDIHQLKTIQHELRPDTYGQDNILVTWNPPWLLFLLAPLGLLPFEIAARVWLSISILLFGLVLRMSWQLINQSGEELDFLVVLFAGLFFGATLFHLILGQVSILIILSLVLFIHLVKSGKDWFAGAVLLMTAIKPHLVYLACLVIIFWIVNERRWKVFAGMAVALLTSILVAWLVNPGWLSSYLSTLSTLPYQELSTSTFGSFMSLKYGIKAFNLAGLLLLPLGYYLAKFAGNVNLFTAINISLLISLPFSPYGFFFDQVLLLPAVAQMVIWIRENELPRNKAWVLISGMSTIYIIIVWLLTKTNITYYWFFWVPLALLGLYMIGLKRRSRLPHFEQSAL